MNLSGRRMAVAAVYHCWIIAEKAAKVRRIIVWQNVLAAAMEVAPHRGQVSQLENDRVDMPTDELVEDQRSGA
jgi:hypothetical protein